MKKDIKSFHSGLGTVKLCEDDGMMYVEKTIIVEELTSTGFNQLSNEGKILTLLQDTVYVPQIMGEGYDNEGNYILEEEYIEGMSLLDIINNASISKQEKIEIMSKLLKAIREIHSYGIVHKDLKPNNIIVDKNNNVRIIDFGISLKEGTECDMIAGTTYYSAPEQLKLNNTTSFIYDVYSLGKIYMKLFNKEMDNRLKKELEEMQRNRSIHFDLDEFSASFNKIYNL